MTLSTLPKLQRVLAQRQRVTLQNDSLVAAAVLVPIFYKLQDPCLLLTKRTSWVERHKGEICFPGGARDPQDHDLLATALRESLEELGLHVPDVRILGVLDDVPVVTGFVITPFVGVIPYPYAFVPNPLEIQELLEIPYSALSEEDGWSTGTRVVNGKLNTFHRFSHNGQVVWGATAQILRQLLQILPELHKGT